jgi:hypothetical protein
MHFSPFLSVLHASALVILLGLIALKFFGIKSFCAASQALAVSALL